MLMDDKSKIIEIFENYDNNWIQIREILEKYKKYDILKTIKSELYNKIKDTYLNLDDKIINEISEKVQNKKLKIEIEYKIKPESYNYDDENGIKLQESIKKIKYFLNNNQKKDVIWKPCREILGKTTVILPEKIDNSNFNQGCIADCYFISCVNSLSQVPQLLNFIMGLSSKYYKNKDNYFFIVNFFIDGKWKIVKVKDSFPCFKDTNELVGVKPKENELFMMILEKAWAQINGGYDQIEGGNTKNIFELFFGSRCKNFKSINTDKLYKSIKKNEKSFGTLSLCSSPSYDILNNDVYKDTKNFIKTNSINKIRKSGFHSYKIVKTLEIQPRLNQDKYDTCKLLIIADPHGKKSDSVSNGIELSKIEEILEKIFGKENKSQYEYILEKNKNYGYNYIDEKNCLKRIEGTGIIFMPLEYFKEWSSYTYVCNPHYGCISYMFDIKAQFENLYIFKIKLNEKQLFTCQVCFQSFRAHRDKIDRITKIFISEETKTQQKDEICLIKRGFLLNYNFCGIKIIKNDSEFSVIKNYCSYRNNDYDFSSIKEANLLLDTGEYYIMIYPESSINEGVIRFLSEKEIEIKLLNKINIKEINNLTTEDIFIKIFDFDSSNKNKYNLFLKSDEIILKEKDYLNPNKEIKTEFHKEYFLPGIKEYYLYFKNLAEKKGLKADEAIYSISKDGETYFYDIIDSNSLNKIYGMKKKNGIIKVDQIFYETLIFRDSLGAPYKINNEKELIPELKINKEPICCLGSQYDENTEVLTSGTIYLTRYYNEAKGEDIFLIETDKSGLFKQRQQPPLFIIILDISGSMHKYTDNLQNQLIPKLLRKLGYLWEETDLYNKLVEKKVTNFELLQAISSKIKLENFLKYYNMKDSIKPEALKKFCNNIIPLITFSDDSDLYFYDIFKFEKNRLYGGHTYFKEAANNLKQLLNSVSRERSIRLLSFSDGKIDDSDKSIKILEKILNSGKTKHQMNSISVRIYHDTQPDTKVLMRLSSFSHPICDMTQVIIDIRNEKEINEAVDKLYNLFINDDMIYNLKITSDIIFMSNDFSSTAFNHEQYFNRKNQCLRINKHLEKINDYKSILKSPFGNLIIEEGGKLNEYDFYNIMSNNASFIAQRILERKVNKKNNLRQNQEIIDYFKEIENNFDNKTKLYKLFEEIHQNKEIYQMKDNKLSEYISEIKNKVKKIIEINNNLDKKNNDDVDRLIRDLKNIINVKKDEIRKEKIDKYNKELKIDILNNERNELKKKNEELCSENNKLKEGVNKVIKDKNELDKEKTKLNDQINKLNELNLNLKKYYNNILDKIKKNFKEENENLKNKKDSELNKLKEDFKRLKDDYDKLNKDYQFAKKNEVFIDYYEKLKDSNNALIKEFNNLKKEREDSNIKEKNLKLENSNLKSRLQELFNQLVKSQLSIEELKEKNNKLKSENDLLNKGYSIL